MRRDPLVHRESPQCSNWLYGPSYSIANIAIFNPSSVAHSFIIDPSGSGGMPLELAREIANAG